jgi:membrane protein implicated in regulation of membrane protease activity
MDRLYEWVDANPPSPERSFYGRRAAKLFLAILASSVLAAFPLTLWQAVLARVEHQQQEERQQEQLRQQMIDLEKAAQHGDTGEATRRLFGISTQTQTAHQRPSSEGAGSKGTKE